MWHASFRSLILLAYLAPAVASAQAWLPDKGTLNTSLLFNNQLYTAHWSSTGDTIPGINVRADTLALLGSYGITDRVMVSGVLPYIRTRYQGPPSHLPPGTPPGTVRPGFEADDGSWHGYVTDIRLGLHYQLLEKPFALAPFVAFVTPVSDYPTKGHAAPGRGLDELILGFSAGKSLDPWIPRSYAQLRYSYAFVEELQNVKHDRSNLNLELGTFFTPRWNVSLYGAWQWTHGGIDVPVPPSSPHFIHHDQLAEDEFFNAGFGAGFSLTPELTAYATYMQGIEGKNGHKVDQSITVGISYGYRPRAEAVGLAAADSNDEAEAVD
jgi:outer membrane putative beta-barrel porin/alpha-amylase